MVLAAVWNTDRQWVCQVSSPTLEKYNLETSVDTDRNLTSLFVVSFVVVIIRGAVRP